MALLNWNVDALFVIKSFIFCFVGYHILLGFLWLVQIVKNHRQLRQNFPGPTPNWLFGNLRDKPRPFGAQLEWQHIQATRFPRVYLMWFGPSPAVTLIHPEPIREFLNVNSVEKTEIYKTFYDWLGNGLAVADGENWKRKRKLVANSFQVKMLQCYMKTYNKVADDFLVKLNNYHNEGKSFLLHHNMSLCTLDTILRTAFSYKSGCQDRGDSAVYTNINRIGDIVFARIAVNPLLLFKPFFWLSRYYKPWWESIRYMHSLQARLVGQRRQEYAQLKRQKKEIIPRDFLDTILNAFDENGQLLTDIDIRDEVNTYLFGGHDTTSSSMTWLLYCMAKFPEYQKKVQEEIDEIFAGRDTDDVVWDDINKFEFLTRCIKESLRMYSVMIVSRRNLEPLLIDGKPVPRGTFIMLNYYGLHHNPSIWGDDHLEYRPDRFLSENLTKLQANSYLPFSAGPRNCLGQQFAMQQIKVLSARILRRFRLKLERDAVIDPKMMSKPEPDILLSVYPR